MAGFNKVSVMKYKSMFFVHIYSSTKLILFKIDLIFVHEFLNRKFLLDFNPLKKIVLKASVNLIF